MRPNEKEYNKWLTDIQAKVAAGKDCNILGMNIPTDNTPSHLGLPERVHVPFMACFGQTEYSVYRALSVPDYSICP